MVDAFLELLSNYDTAPPGGPNRATPESELQDGKKEKEKGREAGAMASQRAHPRLTLDDRRGIEPGLNKGESVREIARRLQPRQATQGRGRVQIGPLLVAIADD